MRRNSLPSTFKGHVAQEALASQRLVAVSSEPP